jgi:predicted unusual protein kinase regulating ubiquinone biosynthesis (AarF/ABC1/UbiB family)
MQRSGVKLSLVCIPWVIEEICTLNVLEMEYLEGISLSDAIDMEQQRMEKALGMRDRVELKTVMAGKMRKQCQ